MWNIKERGGIVKFQNLVDFVKRESKKANDPTYGKEALLSPDQKVLGKKTSSPPMRQTRNSFSTNLSQTNKTGDTKRAGDQKWAERYVKFRPRSQPPTDNETDKGIKRPDGLAKPCLHCLESSHSLNECDRLFKLPFRERIDNLRGKGLCYGCLKPGHQNADCKHRAVCQHCQRRHPTVLHYGNISPNQDSVNITDKLDGSIHTDSANVSSVTLQEKLSGQTRAGDIPVDCTMAVVPVTVRMNNGMQQATTYAFLDPGSNVSFCTDELAHKLGCSVGKTMDISINTMGDKHYMNTHLIKGLEVCDLQGENVVALPDLYTKDHIPVSRNHIPTQEDIAKWPHMNGVVLPQIDADIGIMIGNNVPDVYTPLQLKTGPCGSPHAAKTRIGWIAWNVIRDQHCDTVLANMADVLAVNQLHDINELSKQYERSVNLDFPEHSIDDKREPSREDIQFVEKVQASMTKTDGHYEICLPFRGDILMPDNRMPVLNRLRSLGRKLENNSQFRNEYVNFMNTIIQRGYAEPVPEDELEGDELVGKVWFIPHHGVYHAKKPNKIRVVFDCAATYQGVSLNSTLLQGPNLTNNIVDVLMKFRQHEVALMSDIESMFYQVKVPPQDRNYLRFYWWPGGDLTREPTQYRMTVHLFGSVSSPTCSNVALRQVVEDNKYKFNEEVCSTVLSNFYVDDLLTSVCSEAEAISLVHDLKSLCSTGGFNLTKWVSNSRVVLESIPVDDRAKDVKQLDLGCEELPVERALGVCWNVQSDTLGFKIDVKSAVPTRRNILSIVSSVYDPLGHAAPFVLPAKLLLQDLCRRGVNWDLELSGSDLQKWQNWLYQLPQLECLEVPRCYKPTGFGDVTSYQIHTFSDASELGYGMVSYVRLVNKDERIHCALLIGKSRVTPLKIITIPRLELAAATMAVRITRRMLQQLGLHADQSYFWTDSMTVIRYVRNETTRFKTFVANRVAVIREGSEVSQWKHVESQLNPADDASRGLSLDNVSSATRWTEGPNFLWKPPSDWPDMPGDSQDIPDNDPEIKKMSNVAVVQSDPEPIDQLILRFSSWLKLKRVTAWVLTFIQNIRTMIQRRKEFRDQIKLSQSDEHIQEQLVEAEMTKHRESCRTDQSTKRLILSNTNVMNAERLLFRYEQTHYFSEDMKKMMSIQEGQDCYLNKGSPLFKLDPKLVDGVIRVGGRLQCASIDYDAKHQVILPRQSRISALILEDTHKAVGHLGRSTTLAKLHEKFWIIGANQSIRKLLARCVICRKYQGRCGNQKMADLPPDRVHPDDPPFTHVGVDYFGPIEVKRGRGTVKRYGVLFTCLTSRAVHLEIAYSLDTDSCVNAIRRFIARRGQVKLIRSDNGSNLVGAARELKEGISSWNEEKFHKALHQQQITWQFNPPGGSHFGGVWERLIRSVRKILFSLLHEQMSWRLDDELLQTVFCEVEAILNSRPITMMSSDMNDLEVLTPNHLLLLQSGSSLPCGIFNSDDNYARRRWRQVQHIANRFWTRWAREYLPALQARQKWTRKQNNLKEGDIVLLVDSSPRSSWTLGRVLETIKDKKGLVRIVKVKTKTNILQRPVDKLCVILDETN